MKIINWKNFLDESDLPPNTSLIFNIHFHNIRWVQTPKGNQIAITNDQRMFAFEWIKIHRANQFGNSKENKKVTVRIDFLNGEPNFESSILDKRFLAADKRIADIIFKAKMNSLR